MRTGNFKFDSAPQQSSQSKHDGKNRAATKKGGGARRHAVNSPAAPSYRKNSPNGASLLASSRTRRETAPTLVGIEPPFSAQLITRPSRARSRTLSDLPPARSRGVHDARENPFRPTSA